MSSKAQEIVRYSKNVRSKIKNAIYLLRQGTQHYPSLFELCSDYIPKMPAGNYFLITQLATARVEEHVGSLYLRLLACQTEDILTHLPVVIGKINAIKKQYNLTDQHIRSLPLDFLRLIQDNPVDINFLSTILPRLSLNDINFLEKYTHILSSCIKSPEDLKTLLASDPKMGPMIIQHAGWAFRLNQMESDGPYLKNHPDAVACIIYALIASTQQINDSFSCFIQQNILLPLAQNNPKVDVQRNLTWLIRLLYKDKSIGHEIIPGPIVNILLASIQEKLPLEQLKSNLYARLDHVADEDKLNWLLFNLLDKSETNNLAEVEQKLLSMLATDARLFENMLPSLFEAIADTATFNLILEKFPFPMLMQISQSDNIKAFACQMLRYYHVFKKLGEIPGHQAQFAETFLKLIEHSNTEYENTENVLILSELLLKELINEFDFEKYFGINNERELKCLNINTCETLICNFISVNQIIQQSPYLKEILRDNVEYIVTGIVYKNENFLSAFKYLLTHIEPSDLVQLIKLPISSSTFLLNYVNDAELPLLLDYINRGNDPLRVVTRNGLYINHTQLNEDCLSYIVTFLESDRCPNGFYLNLTHSTLPVNSQFSGKLHLALKENKIKPGTDIELKDLKNLTHRDVSHILEGLRASLNEGIRINNSKIPTWESYYPVGLGHAYFMDCLPVNQVKTKNPRKIVEISFDKNSFLFFSSESKVVSNATPKVKTINSLIDNVANIIKSIMPTVCAFTLNDAKMLIADSLEYVIQHSIMSKQDYETLTFCPKIEGTIDAEAEKTVNSIIKNLLRELYDQGLFKDQKLLGQVCAKLRASPSENTLVIAPGQQAKQRLFRKQ